MPVAIRYEPRDRDLSVRWIRYDIHGLASSGTLDRRYERHENKVLIRDLASRQQH